MMQDEEVCAYTCFEHGYRHVDQEGVGCIDVGLPMMQHEEVYRHRLCAHRYWHVDQEETEAP